MHALTALHTENQCCCCAATPHRQVSNLGRVSRNVLAAHWPSRKPATSSRPVTAALIEGSILTGPRACPSQARIMPGFRLVCCVATRTRHVQYYVDESNAARVQARSAPWLLTGRLRTYVHIGISFFFFFLIFGSFSFSACLFYEAELSVACTRACHSTDH